jgi:arabinan endo-1,5-alpha-L-arabinosidase
MWRLIVIACSVLMAQQSHAQQLENGEPVPAGDPTLSFAEGAYHLFSSGRGLPVFRSKDLVTWQPAGELFGSLPAWASSAVPEHKDYVWAPDVVKIDGEYRVYWSTSTPGSRRSVIGYASSRSLDKNSPDYRWLDRGKVMETTPQDDWNAIDPQCFVDQEGNVWLVMGSYWSGIKLRLLDKESGKPSARDSTLYSLARRPGVDPPAIEGAYMIWRDGFYYLWVSFDRCNWNIHSNYNIRVGRSRKVTGPFADRGGRQMTEGGGTLVLASCGAVRGPGHNSVLQHGSGTWLAHHYFNPATGGRRTLQIRPVFWDEDGWPVAGEPVRPEPEKQMPPAGRWEYSLDFGEPMTITLSADGAVRPPVAAASWKLDGDQLVLTWKRSGDDGRDPLRERCFYAPDGSWFVGRNRHGQIVRGRRISD